MLDKIREIICHFVDIDPSEITEETGIHSDLGLNSLELVNIAVAVEEAFDLRIPDREAAGIATVGDVVNLIKKKQ